MKDLDDWELVALAQAGDMRAFGEVVRRYQVPVMHFCQRMLGSAQDAEDLAQESFVRLYRYLHRLEPQAKFSTAMFGIARNLTLNHLRDSGRRGRGRHQPLDTRPLPAPESAGPASQARLREIEERLSRALEALSPDHREVLILRELQGLDYVSIGRVLGCRQGTVRSRLARAREQLRQKLTEQGGDAL